ncbi:MAG: response regulator [Thermodesulfobacteriota bacterium]
MEPGRTRVLIIDDEPPIRRLLLNYLEDYDEFEVRSARSAEMALEELRREPADVAVVDMRLPGMSGESFILAAGREGLCRRFLLHTGSVDLVLSDDIRGLGVTEKDVFLKPADMDELLERIRETPGAGGR